MWGQPLGLGQPTGSYITRERPSLINYTVNNSFAEGVVLGAPFPVPKPQKEHFIMRKAIDTFTNVLILTSVKKIKHQSCCTQHGMSKQCALTVCMCCSLTVTVKQQRTNMRPGEGIHLAQNLGSATQYLYDLSQVTKPMIAFSFYLSPVTCQVCYSLTPSNFCPHCKSLGSRLLLHFIMIC